MEKVILKNDNLSVTILTLGATVQNITAYGISLTAGFDTKQEYLNHTCYFGALIGRTANRTGNTNQINGATINLPLNEKGI
ncbi:MAG: galactose mutarotase, partial [Clostridia bacterium]|nr:galactose mutarotase [Clostridia bacterium]